MLLNLERKAVAVYPHMGARFHTTLFMEGNGSVTDGLGSQISDHATPVTHLNLDSF